MRKTITIILLFIIAYVCYESTINKSLPCGRWEIESGDRKGQELVLLKNGLCFFSSNPEEMLEYSFNSKCISIYSSSLTHIKKPGFDDTGKYWRNRKGTKMRVSWYDSPRMRLKLIKRYD